MGARHPRNKSKSILEGDHQVQKAQRLESSWAVFLALQGMQNPLEILLKHRSPRHSESAGRGWGSRDMLPLLVQGLLFCTPCPTPLPVLLERSSSLMYSHWCHLQTQIPLLRAAGLCSVSRLPNTHTLQMPTPGCGLSRLPSAGATPWREQK